MTILWRVAGAVLLAVSAWKHLELAPSYDAAQGTALTVGDLFRVQGVLALLLGVALLVRDRWWAWTAAAAAMAASLLAVLASVYVQVDPIGPLPTLYEPVWYADKTLTAYAEGAFVVLAAVRLVVWRLRSRPVSSGRPLSAG